MTLWRLMRNPRPPISYSPLVWRNVLRSMVYRHLLFTRAVCFSNSYHLFFVINTKQRLVILGTSLVTHLPDIDFASMDALSRKKTGFPFEKPSPKSLEQGISTTLVAVLSPDLANQSGAYLQDCQICETREYAHDGNLADQLWELSEELVGGEFQIGAT